MDWYSFARLQPPRRQLWTIREHREEIKSPRPTTCRWCQPHPQKRTVSKRQEALIRAWNLQLRQYTPLDLARTRVVVRRQAR